MKSGYASRNKWCLRCLLKTGNVKAEEIWVGSLFQTWDAVDEKDFEVAIDVSLNGADMVIQALIHGGIYSLQPRFISLLIFSVRAKSCPTNHLWESCTASEQRQNRASDLRRGERYFWRISRITWRTIVNRSSTSSYLSASAFCSSPKDFIVSYMRLPDVQLCSSWIFVN